MRKMFFAIMMMMVSVCAMAQDDAATPQGDAKFQKTMAKAEAGDPGAMLQIAGWYKKGAHGVEKSEEKEKEWKLKAKPGLEKQAANGNTNSMKIIADQYEKGVFSADGQKDYANAYTWYKKAADAGDLDATAKVAGFMMKGRGTAKNKEEGLKLYQKGADAGNINCMMGLADYYGPNKKGEAKDVAKAKELYEKVITACGDDRKQAKTKGKAQKALDAINGAE